jgi:hypothetical protein
MVIIDPASQKDCGVLCFTRQRIRPMTSWRTYSSYAATMLALAVCLVAVHYSLPALAQGINPNLWQTYVNKEFGFRISYPNDWKVIPPKGPNVHISVSPASGPGNCNVVARTMADLKGMAQQQLNKEVEAMPIDDASWAEYLNIPQSRLSMIERRRARIGNVPAIYGSFEATFETLEGRYFGKKVVAMTFTPGVLWTITCGVSTYKPQEGRQRYDELKPYLTKILGSFTFLGSR